MTFKELGSRGLVIVLCALLCNVPQYLNAQAVKSSDQQSPATQQQQNGAQPGEPDGQEAQTGSRAPDPAQAPLAPVQTTRQPETNTTPPDAPSEVQRSQQAPTPAATPEVQPAQQQPTNPLGTATAQQGATRGGAASKPAGEAIAPTKQRQVHSVLIRLGLLAAGAAAVGTVVALTRGTSSIPPGAH